MIRVLRSIMLSKKFLEMFEKLFLKSIFSTFSRVDAKASWNESKSYYKTLEGSEIMSITNFKFEYTI